MDNIPLRKKTT